MPIPLSNRKIKSDMEEALNEFPIWYAQHINPQAVIRHLGYTDSVTPVTARRYFNSWLRTRENKDI